MQSESSQSVRRWVGIGALLLACSVICGAFGAHALKGKLGEYEAVYDKAVFYQFVHAIGICMVGVLGELRLLSGRQMKIVGAIFFFGIIFFCGSLYVLAISGVRTFGMITPIGGVLFIAGWLCLAWFMKRQS